MDAESSTSSLETCYSPTEAVLTLTPYNAEAKLEFSKVADWLQEQNEQIADAARKHARKYMHIFSEPVPDSDVAQVLRRRETGTVSSSPTSSPPSHSRLVSRAETVPVWTGFYYLDFGEPPLAPARGWVAGRLRQGQHPNDLVLSLAQDQHVLVRQNHAVFQLSDTRLITVHSRVDMAAVNDETLATRTGPYYLQDAESMLTLGRLKYRVAYSPFSRSEHCKESAANYLRHFLGKRQSPMWEYFDTPRGDTSIQVGGWRVTSSGTVGTSASGRVSIGLNQAGRVVALKRISVDGKRSSVMARRDTMRKITRLAEQASEARVLLLLDVIDDDPSGSNRAVDV
ncbi:hypothetical protein NHJ13051_004467 [Beauveria bassiana]